MSLFIDLELLTLSQNGVILMIISHITKRICVVSLMFLNLLGAYAQHRYFDGHFFNEEYNIYLVINLYENKIVVPGQEIFGEMAGYLGDYKDGRKWLITDAKINSNDNSAELSMVNDYGSEDLKAEFTRNKDGNYTLKQLKGSSLKIARNRKWVKLPKLLIFKVAKK